MMRPLRKIKQLAQKAFKPRPPDLPFPDTLNIETSYACNLRCVMCPRQFDKMSQGYMSLDLFRERIAPALPHFHYVHLAGWGEPLVNPHFAELVRLCKQAGCWTCFTCNGLLLRPPLSRELLALGVDQINVSCDAATAATYEYVRGKGTFGQLMERLRDFFALFPDFPSPPTIQWAFVMMKYNIGELPAAVRLAAQLGFHRIIAKHMETAINREGLDEALFHTGVAPDLTPEEEARFQQTLDEARQAARETGIPLDIHPRRMSAEGMCLVHPLRNLFVDWQGYVSPCCYLNRINVKPYIEHPPEEDGVLGSVEKISLLDLIASPEYERFRREWAEGRVPAACRGCLQIARITTHP